MKCFEISSSHSEPSELDWDARGRVDVPYLVDGLRVGESLLVKRLPDLETPAPSKAPSKEPEKT